MEDIHTRRVLQAGVDPFSSCRYFDAFALEDAVGAVAGSRGRLFRLVLSSGGTHDPPYDA